MATERLAVILELVSGQYKREAREAAVATGQIGGAAKTASGQMTVFDRSTQNVSNKLRGLATGALVAAGAGIIKFGADSVKAASDLEESMNAVNVVFGSAADTITDFGEQAATSAGLAQAEFQQMASVLGSALINAGIPLDEAAEKTIELTQRAADMASVFNTSVPDALGAMQAALRGESDPIEKFGVTLSAAAVDAEAAVLGFKKVSGQFDAQAKAAARLSLIMKQTDRVAGDFQNTSDGLANSSRVLTANFTNLQAQIGGFLTPALASLSGEAIEVTEGFAGFFGVLDKVVESLGTTGERTDEVNALIDRQSNLLDILIPGLGSGINQWAALNDQLERNELASIKVIDKGEQLIEIHDSWTLASAKFNPIFGETVGLIERGAVAFSNAAAAADSQRTALIRLTEYQRSQLSPISNFVRLQEELVTAQEALATAQADGETPASDLALAQIEVADAMLAVTAAGLSLNPEEIQAFAQLLVTEFGYSEDAAQDLLEQLGLFDGFVANVKVNFEVANASLLEAIGSSGINNVDIQVRHGGGVVAGPRGSEQLILAQGGEGIIPLSQMGGSTTSNSRANNFYFADRGPDRPVDLQYLALLSNHQTFGKF